MDTKQWWELLLKRKATVDSMNEFGQTPPHFFQRISWSLLFFDSKIHRARACCEISVGMMDIQCFVLITYAIAMCRGYSQGGWRAQQKERRKSQNLLFLEKKRFVVGAEIGNPYPPRP